MKVSQDFHCALERGRGPRRPSPDGGSKVTGGEARAAQPRVSDRSSGSGRRAAACLAGARSARAAAPRAGPTRSLETRAPSAAHGKRQVPRGRSGSRRRASPAAPPAPAAPPRPGFQAQIPGGFAAALPRLPFRRGASCGSGASPARGPHSWGPGAASPDPGLTFCPYTLGPGTDRLHVFLDKYAPFARPGRAARFLFTQLTNPF